MEFLGELPGWGGGQYLEKPASNRVNPIHTRFGRSGQKNPLGEQNWPEKKLAGGIKEQKSTVKQTSREQTFREQKFREQKSTWDQKSGEQDSRNKSPF